MSSSRTAILRRFISGSAPFHETSHPAPAGNGGDATIFPLSSSSPLQTLLERGQPGDFSHLRRHIVAERCNPGTSLAGGAPFLRIPSALPPDDTPGTGPCRVARSDRAWTPPYSPTSTGEIAGKNPTTTGPPPSETTAPLPPETEAVATLSIASG
jgi:hypothetical protein